MFLRKMFLLWAFSLVLVAQCKPNLHIGTGGFGYGCGSNSPAAQVPHSFVRLGPDTTPMEAKRYEKFAHYGGYHDSDHAVKAFSHMHLVGAGIIDMGVFGFLPLIPKNENLNPDTSQDHIVPMSKQDQIAQPGYYSTLLQRSKIKIQLTTTQRCGAHRYTYINYKNKPMDIHIMTSYLLDKKALRYSITQTCGHNCVEGRLVGMSGFGGRFGGYTTHFHMELTNLYDQDSKTYLYKDSEIVGDDVRQVQGNHTGAVIRTKSNVVQILVGISYVSIENARMNFQKQVKGKNFDTIKKQAQEQWNNQLKRFDIYAINQQIQTKIDTAIYRTLLSPTIFQDFNGEYLSFRNDGTTQFKPSTMKHVYTDMSLWDVHRTQMPWILFHDVQRYSDIAMSIVLINREGGYMPKWPFAQGATGCMIGSHANTVLADWIVKQAHKTPHKVNISEIFSFMLRNANNRTVHDQRWHPTEYIKKGYIPIENQTRSSCSETLEYSYNDYGIAQIAKLLNDTQTHDQFIRRSKFYKNLFNPKTKFFEPRSSNGTFKKISVLERTNIFSNNYVEGDAWHYRFYAPHDAAGLIELFGGEKIFVRELNKLFARNPMWPTFWLPNPYYWPGNQHDLFSVWLFPYANRSDLTQKYSRQIVDTSYGLDGSGLPGNDDYATMSAWLTFAVLGFYPLPSTETYILGSPYIHYARIDRRISENETLPFRIRVNNNTKSNEYVRKVELNKKEIKNFVTHSQLNDPDVTLEFWMQHRETSTKIEQVEQIVQQIAEQIEQK